MLINKADYLTEELRAHWSAYFNENNINHVFFSALLEQEKLDKHEDSEDESDDEEYDDNGEKIVKESKLTKAKKLANVEKERQ